MSSRCSAAPRNSVYRYTHRPAATAARRPIKRVSNSLSISPIGPFHATIRPPGSKSLTNRALLLAALARGTSTLHDVLLADDTRRMIGALSELGLDLAQRDDGPLTVAGCEGRLPEGDFELNLGNAGTAIRTLTAACCLGRGTYTLDGISRMRQRPIGQLVDPLRELGANIDYVGDDGYPPMKITGGALRGGSVAIGETLSSQYVTALLICGPYMDEGLTIQFTGPVTSQPYVAMTLSLMKVFGIEADVDESFTRITVPRGQYAAADYRVEPDASSASYFLAAAAIIPGSKVTIEGLGRRSLQGDVGFADVLQQMGAGLVFGNDFVTVIGPEPGKRLRGVDIDLNKMPDMAQTLAAIAPLCIGPTTIRNVGNLRIKETDRMAALEAELTKLGAVVEVDGDDLTIHPPTDGRIKPACIDTYDDHRMAMSFAVTGLAADGVVINEPQCVNKTFPEFYEYLYELAK